MHIHLISFCPSPPVNRPTPPSPLCVTGSKGASWTEWWFSWRILPARFCLGVKQITLCMHEYITSAAVIIPGKATAFGTCALLPSWLLCSHCHCNIIKWIWVLAVRVSAGVIFLFIYRESEIFHTEFVGGRFIWWNIYKIEAGLLRYPTTLKLNFYGPQHYWHSKYWSCLSCLRLSVDGFPNCGASTKQSCGHFYISVMVWIWLCGLRTVPRMGLKTL